MNEGRPCWPRLSGSEGQIKGQKDIQTRGIEAKEGLKQNVLFYAVVCDERIENWSEVFLAVDDGRM